MPRGVVKRVLDGDTIDIRGGEPFCMKGGTGNTPLICITLGYWYWRDLT